MYTFVNQLLQMFSTIYRCSKRFVIFFYIWVIYASLWLFGKIHSFNVNNGYQWSYESPRELYKEIYRLVGWVAFADFLLFSNINSSLAEQGFRNKLLLLALKYIWGNLFLDFRNVSSNFECHIHVWCFSFYRH